MNKLTTGMIVGGVVGAISFSYIMSDKRSRNRLMKDGKKLMKKGKIMMEDVSDMF